MNKRKLHLDLPKKKAMIKMLALKLKTSLLVKISFSVTQSTNACVIGRRLLYKLIFQCLDAELKCKILLKTLSNKVRR